MLTESVMLLTVIISVVSCQINGEFWWLNKDVTKLKHGTAPPPQFDDVNELDTDETAKVVFRDEIKKGKSLNRDKDKINGIHFRDETELAKPIFEFGQVNMNNKLWGAPINKFDNKNNNSSQNPGDEFQFVFPSDENLLWIKDSNNNTSHIKDGLESSSITNSTNEISNGGILSVEKNALIPKNICTFIKKSECIRKDGTLYEPWIKSNAQNTISDTQKICCILPIATTTIAKIIFPDNYWKSKRHRRSNAEDESPALKQRTILMNRKYTHDKHRLRVTTPATRKKVTEKVVNSDEYSKDPYWNIKNSEIRNPDIPSYQDPDTGYDYESQSYGDDYTVELPKPGLIGLYSDHKKTQSTWVHNNNNNKGYSYDTVDSVEDEEFESSFGYSTIDPRQDSRLTSKPSKPHKRRPLRITSTSPVPEPDLSSSTISFHSNPDFQVLQGFKLLNLARHKNRLVRKTAGFDKECSYDGVKVQEKPSKCIYYYDDEQESLEANLEQKIVKECGKVQNKYNNFKNSEKQGVVDFADHPWIALVVLTKNEHSILCYATLVHGRAAVTVADCVEGKPPGAVSIIAGVRNLNEDLARSQRRMTTITLDADYTSGRLANNLALLHWLRPLTLDSKVQPVCLADPHIEDTCVFVGWGGYDQEMHSDLRWQRASILAPQKCSERLSKLEVSDALCAAVESRGTVTGVGGPLLCKTDGRWSAVAVAVRRNAVIVLLPTRSWVTRNLISLRIQ